MAYPLTEMSKEEIIRILRGYDSIEASPGERKAWDEFTVGTIDTKGLFPDDDTKWEDFPKTILTAAVREGEAIFGEVGDVDYAGTPEDAEADAIEDVVNGNDISDSEEIEIIDGDDEDIYEIEDADDESIIVDDEDGDIEVYIEGEDDNLEVVDLDGLDDEQDIEEDVDQEQLAKGIEIEMEHTQDPEIAKEIALDHLTEIPDYYSRLDDIEEVGEDEGDNLVSEESRKYKIFKFGKAKEELIQELNSYITDTLAELTEEELKIVNSKLVEEESVELTADDGQLKELLEKLNRLQEVGKEFFDTFKGVISDFVDENEDEEEPVEEGRGFWFDEDKVFNSDDRELLESVIHFAKKMDSSDPRIKKLEDRLAELEAPTEESKTAKDILKSIFEEAKTDEDGSHLSNKFSVEFVKNVSDLDKDEIPGKQRFEIVIDGNDFVAIIDTPKQKVTWEGTKPKHHAEIGKELLFGDLFKTVGQDK